MNDLVTILLPTYNGQEYVSQMLDSIYFQDYRPIELIICDDASTDDTVNVVSRWRRDVYAKDISIKLIRNLKNEGLSRNISIAAKRMHGKYLLLADQDDIWKCNKISEQIKYLKENIDCVICICDRSIINNENKIICPSLFRYKSADLKKRNLKKVMNSNILYPANCMCIRTEHIEKIFPIPRGICEHDTFIAIMAAHYGNIGYVRQALTLYRIHGNNLSAQYALETNRSLLKAGQIIIKGFKRKNRREAIDPLILERELKNRFQERISKWSPKLYSGKVKHIYLETLRYIYHNWDKRKKFC